MPGIALTGSARVALFGKLPAHGDFIRRGDPALVRRLDAWLTGEIERRAMADGDALDARLSALPTWCFLLPDGTSGALAASSDRVGRVFPVVACIAGDRVAAEQVATLLVNAMDGIEDADRMSAAMAAIDASKAEDANGSEAGEGRDAAATWWQPYGDSPARFSIAGLPSGADFARLLTAEA